MATKGIVPRADNEGSIGTAVKRWLSGYFGTLFAKKVVVEDGAGNYLQAPKLTTTQRDALTGVNGMVIYNTTTDQLEKYEASAWSAFVGVGGGSGEANTAANVGVAGVGIYKEKSGVELRFKKLNAGSNKIAITDDTTNSEVDVDVAETNINHANLTNLDSSSYSHISAAQKTDLTDGNDSTLHYHASDRNRANHTGTQTASTISDFNSAALSASPAETTTTTGSLINSATAKATPVDADMVGLMDSAASNVLKKLSWLNIKATLKTYFDTLYAVAGDIISAISTHAAVTATHGATGAVVGTTNTQTLSNKTLTAPIINNPTGFLTGAAKITVASSAPSSPSTGDLWVDTT